MATDHERIEDVGEGLSRRQVLARGAVVAGVVWAAPVIRTATAYATSASGTERPCNKFYLVCLDKYGPRPVRFVNPENGYDEMPAASIVSRFRPVEEPAPTTTSSTSSTTTSSTSSTTTSSTSSTTTSSTSSTTTTSTTKPFKDPTEGLGLFPDDEASEDPRDKKKKKKESEKNGKKKTAAEEAEPDPEDVVAPSIDPTSPAIDALGLFPGEPDPAAVAAAEADAATLLPDVLPPGIKSWLEDNPDVPVRYPEVPPMLTQTGEQAWAVLLSEVVEGPNPRNHQCRSVKGWSQAGTKHSEYYEDPDPFDPDEAGRRLIFPNPIFENTDQPGPIDRVFVVYCCP